MRSVRGRLLLLALPVLGATVPAAAQVIEPSRVLVIQGNADIGPWELDFDQTLLQSVSVEASMRVTLDYVDRRVADETEASAMIARIRADPPDLVIAVQPEASEFLYRWGDSLAPDAPRLYVLPDQGVADAVRGSPREVLLESALGAAAAETISLLPRLLPRIGRIYVVGGASEGDASYMALIRAAITESDPAVPITYLTGLAPSELVSALRHAPPNAAVVMGPYNGDGRGRTYRSMEVTELLAEETSPPVFGLFDSLLGHAVVGGNVTSAGSYASETARIALEILSDGTVSDATTPPTANVFDVVELARHGIPRRGLPEGSRLINDDPPAWRQYLPGILLGVAIMFLQTALILTLLRSLRSRRRAEEERDRQRLDRANQAILFESIMNTISAALLIIDLDGLIVAGNDSGVANTFGCDTSDLIGARIDRVLGTEARDPRGCAAVCPTEEPSVRTFRRWDGTEFSGECHGGAITDVDGSRTGCFMLVRNVDGRLAKERNRRHTHKMEALGTLAGGVAHDFNNILMAISGSAEIADLHVDRAKEVRSRLADILTASERGKRLVGQILMFSRRDDDEHLEAVDVEDLLRESVSLLGASLPKTVAIEMSVERDLWPVRAKTTQLQQALMNLCANASHAMDESGRLSIEASNVTLVRPKQALEEAIPAGDYVRLVVADSGCGIAKEHIGRIFEPFFTTKPRGKGTGMGLASVYGMVETHGAHLDVQSKVGEGTTVSVYFEPCREEAPAPAAKTEQPATSRGSGESILLIDDEELVVKATHRMLTHLGYDVESHRDPLAGLEAFRTDPERFDLVISDQSMPGMDGVTLLSEIRKTRPELPAILCTGFVERHTGEDLDATILNKPWRVGDIAAAVSDALRDVRASA